MTTPQSAREGCECRIVYHISGVDKILYCPKHASVDRLITATKRAIEWMMSQPREYQHVGVNGAVLNALKAAEGKA